MAEADVIGLLSARAQKVQYRASESSAHAAYDVAATFIGTFFLGIIPLRAGGFRS